MDGIANVARQQQSQVSSNESKATATAQVQQQIKQAPKVDIVKEIQEASTSTSTKINSKEQVESLVADLNRAMAPMNTNLRFGVDRDDIFFVSVVESETSRMIRRFPAEKAESFLGKMQEVTGMLFDSKG